MNRKVGAWRWLVPWSMVWLRAAFGPALALAALTSIDSRWLGLVVILGLLDDIFDGILARRWRTETPALRRADSWADTLFYLGVAAALWSRNRTLMRQHLWLLIALGAFEVARHAFDWWKFRRAASYHSYLAKLWGLVMGVGVTFVISFGGPAWLVTIALLLGIAADCEGLAMSLILPRWQNDVKSLRIAWRLRQTAPQN